MSARFIVIRKLRFVKLVLFGVNFNINEKN